MSDEHENNAGHSARDIVLELFPATNEHLVPNHSKYTLTKTELGSVLIRRDTGEQVLELTPLNSSGPTTTQLCCDFCQHSAPRQFFHYVRAVVSASKGRRFRYVSLCRDTKNCELRRLSDEGVDKLLERVGA